MKIEYKYNKSSKSEIKVISELAKKGIFAIDKGWPDILGIDKEGKIYFIEIKSDTDHLRKEQFIILTILTRLNLDVRIIHPTKDSIDSLGEPLSEGILNKGNELLRLLFNRNSFQLALQTKALSPLRDISSDIVKQAENRA